jgi:hypothetical protein
MKKLLISCFTYMIGVISALAVSVFDALLRVSYIAAERLTPQKLDIELTQSSMQKSTGSAKPIIGSGSGDSPLIFVSMLKAVNGHTSCINCA